MKKSFLVAAASTIALSDALAGGITPTASAAPSTPPAHAHPAPLFGSAHDTAIIMANQPALDAVVDQIRAAAGPNSGLGGVSVDALHNTLHLYWHGQIPVAVTAVVNTARHHNRTVNIQRSPYTEAALIKESHRIIASQAEAASSVKVVSAGPSTDGSRLELGVAPAAHSRVDSSSASTATQAALGSLTKYPFAVSTMASKPTQGWAGSSSLNRWDGGPGLYNMGGEHIRNSSWGGCSVGFAASYNGNDVVLTAAHCGWDNWYRLDGNSVGRTVTSSTTYDIQAISGYSYGDTWLGPDYYDTSGSGQYAEEVVGSAGNSTGDWICTSGAETGYVCDIQVYDTNQTATDEKTGITYSHLVYARDRSPNYTQIIAEGDSGGPVFFPQSNGTIIAKGLIHAGHTQSGIGGQTTCTSTAAINDGVTCYDVFDYEDINAATSYIGTPIKHW
jgi:hypothetical protein